MKIATTQQMRELDRAAIEGRGIPSLTLMENAATHVTAAVLETVEGLSSPHVLAVCGTGNNGGDGLASARQLLSRGMTVTVFLVGNAAHQTPDSIANTRRLEAVGGAVIPYSGQPFPKADCIIDALFGVGLNREVSGLYRAAVEGINAAGYPVISCDIPSGINGDTGEVMGTAVSAARTVTFSCAKPGLLNAPGSGFTGQLSVVNIGIPEDLLAAIPQPEEPVWMRKDMSDPRVIRDVNHPNEFMLLPFPVQDGKKHKVAIICPGGGYDMICGYVEGDPYAERLNEMGISAVVVYYRCKELARFPGPQNDLAQAVREVFAHAEEWDLDMEGYSVWGSSAGGHLAGTFGTEAIGYRHYDLPKPGAMVLVYPVVTMEEHTHEGCRDKLLGEAPAPELCRLTSIERQITSDYPPTYLWCGSADTCVDPENSRMLARALEQAGVPCRFREYPGIEHGAGLGLGTCCQPWFEEAVRFWMEQIT